ncbi:MAG: ATP-binding cassette domain-containing protein [Gammaproteobacteria bacterium]|nr:ATP-binding cassette domain-containing protein [Gammaproteobacteria bacterium]
MEKTNTDVRLVGVSKAYGNNAVLADIDLEVAHGEFVAVLGRSGTGKSTLLNLIGGLDEPARGEVHLLGQQLSSLTETQRAALRAEKLGFVFQFFNLIPTLTARENVELPLAINSTPKREGRRRAHELLSELGLADCDDRFPEELSGGEQQRVAIARAIAHDPAVILADEPTGNLDIETGKTVLALLYEICRRRGTTLIVATHSDEVLGLADRVLRISNALLEETPR